MEDPVTDVLAERGTAGGRLTPAVSLSLLLHATLVVIAIVAARNRHVSTPMTPISIRFAPMTPAAVAPVKSSSRITPVNPPTPARSKPVPAIEQPPVVTSKPVEASKTLKNTVPLSPFGRSTRKGEEKPAPPPSPPAAGATTAPGPIAAIPAIGNAGVTGLEGGDFPYAVYVTRMNTLIAQKWFRPPVRSEALTKVYFTIQRDGTIRDAKIEGESGNGTFDRAALRAVIEASPLPPLPFGYSGTYLGVHLTFH